MRLLVATAMLAACHAQPAPSTVSAEVASVPFEDDFGLIFMQVAVGSAPPRWFLLDSGADQTIIDRGVAAELGLALDSAGKEAEPGGEIAIAHAREVTFHVGGAAFTAPDVIVTPLAALYRFVGRPFAGILGHAFLERYVTRVSYDERRLTFYEPARFRYRGTGESIPVEIVDAEPFVRATLDSGTRRVDARLKLDTGSLEALGLGGTFVARSHLFDGASPRMPRPGVGLGGGTEGVIVRLRSMQLGSHTLGPMAVNYGPGADPAVERSVLAAQVLQRFTVIFDYARRRLLLEPGARYAAPFAPEASGMFGATFENDLRRFIVLAVAPGTPAAEAGLAAGDEVVAIDGTPFAIYGLPRFYRRVHELAPLTLTIRRADTERTLVLALRPLP